MSDGFRRISIDNRSGCSFSKSTTWLVEWSVPDQQECIGGDRSAACTSSDNSSLHMGALPSWLDKVVRPDTEYSDDDSSDEPECSLREEKISLGHCRTGSRILLKRQCRDGCWRSSELCCSSSVGHISVTAGIEVFAQPLESHQPGGKAAWLIKSRLLQGTQRQGKKGRCCRYCRMLVDRKNETYER